MRGYRKKQLITIIALVIVISGLSIGFAAFSTNLLISSSATVTPDSSAFSVLFSSSGTSQATTAITPTVSGGASGENATISGTSISGLKANFTAPGQSVTYAFWSHNVGAYVAYLTNIDYANASGGSSYKVCTPGTGTTSALVTAACDDISVSVSVGSTNATSSTLVSSHSLAVNAYEKVTVTITYASNGDRADGEFSVAFGNISLGYHSVDASTISFTIDGVAYQADPGMTWLQWVNSSYNTINVYEDGGNICTENGGGIWTNSNTVLENGQAYTSSNGMCPT